MFSPFHDDLVIPQGRAIPSRYAAPLRASWRDGENRGSERERERKRGREGERERRRMWEDTRSSGDRLTDERDRFEAFHRFGTSLLELVRVYLDHNVLGSRVATRSAEIILHSIIARGVIHIQCDWIDGCCLYGREREQNVESASVNRLYDMLYFQYCNPQSTIHNRYTHAEPVYRLVQIHISRPSLV